MKAWHAVVILSLASMQATAAPLDNPPSPAEIGGTHGVGNLVIPGRAVEQSASVTGTAVAAFTPNTWVYYTLQYCWAWTDATTQFMRIQNTDGSYNQFMSATALAFATPVVSALCAQKGALYGVYATSSSTFNGLFY